MVVPVGRIEFGLDAFELAAKFVEFATIKRRGSGGQQPLDTRKGAHADRACA